MNLLSLRRLRLGSSGLSLLGCSRSSSIGPRRSLSSCVAAGCAKKEDPRWVILNLCVTRSRRNDDSAAKSTVAECRTSTGRPLSVSLGLAPPPASSFFYYDWPAGSSADEEDSAGTQGFVVAVHGDSALLHVRHKKKGGSSSSDSTCEDYFVYTAGTATKPPSLTLLPGHVDINPRNTGLLRRGEDELLVIKLDLELCFRRDDMAAMWVHRLGGSRDDDEWELKREVPIVLSGNVDGEALPRDGLDSYAPVPVGDRFMCWFDYSCGLLVCDMAEEDDSRLKLRYVQLPVAADDDTGCGTNDRYTWDIGAAGDRAVRFVTVDPRCYCNRDACPNDHNLFAVRTWTLALMTDEEGKKMAWVKGNTLDCEELWALPGYQGLPCTLLEFPVVSSVNPDIVCFMVREGEKMWMVQVDTTNKVILSTVRWNADVTHGAWLVHVSAKFPWLASDTPGASIKS